MLRLIPETMELAARQQPDGHFSATFSLSRRDPSDATQATKAVTHNLQMSPSMVTILI